MDIDEPRGMWSLDQIDSLVRMTKEMEAGDLYLCAGTRPFLKTGDKLHEISEFPVITEKVLEDFFTPFLSEEEWQTWEHRGGDVEKTYRDRDGLHVRISCHNIVQGKGVTCRILHKVPTFTELSPQGTETLTELSSSPQGLIIVTGKANSGKTTTMAAFIDHVTDIIARLS